jgi:hypothetical protein
MYDMISPLVQNARVDRTALSVVDLHDDPGQVDYWMRQPPRKRFEAMEFLRQLVHSYDPDTARLPRVLTVVERSKD